MHTTTIKLSELYLSQKEFDWFCIFDSLKVLLFKMIVLI
jgi:hypothetical protein